MLCQSKSRGFITSLFFQILQRFSSVCYSSLCLPPGCWVYWPWEMRWHNQVANRILTLYFSPFFPSQSQVCPSAFLTVCKLSLKSKSSGWWGELWMSELTLQADKATAHSFAILENVTFYTESKSLIQTVFFEQFPILNQWWEYHLEAMQHPIIRLKLET